jgi:glycosyltransferase involved in cell wall biosynthesis
MQRPLRFALLVPCRNGERFLPRLFASVRAQHRAFDECWLCDDGSDDRSATLALSAGFSLVRNTRSVGPAEARNQLVAQTTCDWVHFHDADDVLDPEYLSTVAERAQTPDADAVICDMRWVNETTGNVEATWRYNEAELRAAPRSYLIRHTVGGINGLYRRATFTRLGGFDRQRDYWEDLEFTARWARGGAHFHVVARDLVTAYRRADSYSNQHLARAWRSKTELLAAWLADCTADERATIAEEAERLAVRLVRLNDQVGAAAALRLNHQAGGNAPETKNPLLRAAKTILPPLWLLRCQDAWRRDRSAVSAAR